MGRACGASFLAQTLSTLLLSAVKIKANANARPGTFFARDNVATFVAWTRWLGVDEAVLFEADDLVQRKNEKNVLYWCDVAHVPFFFFFFVLVLVTGSMPSHCGHYP